MHYAGFRLACHYVAWSLLAVSWLQLSAATPLELYAICRGGQSGKVIDLMARRCLPLAGPLGHPSAANGACTVVQMSSSKLHCSERQASLKAALRCRLFTWYHNFHHSCQNIPKVQNLVPYMIIKIGTCSHGVTKWPKNIEIFFFQLPFVILATYISFCLLDHW